MPTVFGANNTLGPLHIAHGVNGTQYWVEKRLYNERHAKYELLVRRYTGNGRGRLSPRQTYGPFFIFDKAKEEAEFLARIDKARALIAPKE